jgi:Ca2+-binding RTX toxin-like protein
MGIASVRSYILVNATAGTQVSQSSVAALSDGRFAVSYNSNATVSVTTRVFNADGTPYTGQIAVSSGSYSSVAALAGGRFVVAYTEQGTGTADTSGASIRAQIFNADGTVFKAEFLVNTATLYDQTEPSVRALADGRFVVTYTDASTSGGVFGVTDVRARIFNADGTPSVAEFVVNTATPERQNESAVTVLADGRLLITYSVFTPPVGNTPGVTEDRWDIRARILNPNGTQSVAEFRVNGTVYLNQQDSSVAALSDGGFVVAYDNSDGDFGGVSARIFNASGVATVAEFRVNASITGLQRDSQIAALPDGRFVVIFTQNTMGVSPAVHTQRAVIYNNDGTVSVPEFIVQTSDFFLLDSSISVMADGRFVITVADQSDAAVDGVALGVYAHIFDPKVFYGTAAPETVTGGSLNDYYYGGGGNDVLYGRGGNDYLNGGAGADYLDGGDGFDIVGYYAATAGVDARLYLGTGSTGDAAYDAYVSIEGLQGSAFADTLLGDAANNYIAGGDGDDYIDGVGGVDALYGEGGNDTFYLRDGAEIVDGGTGWDTASYSTAATGILASLYSPSQNTGRAAGDTYAGIEALVGSAFGDALVGDTFTNALSGGAGDDYIDGVGGGDYLYGDSGNDQFYLRNDAEVIVGGSDWDNARYVYATAGLRAFLYDPSQNTGYAAGDTYTGVEGLVGSAFGDDLRGDAGSNAVFGEGGNDLLVGLGGQDYYNGGAGLDLFHFVTINDGGPSGDIIQDFASGTDRVSVWGVGFGLSYLAGGGIESYRFVTGTAANLATSQFIYNAPTGQLFYDQDGTGSGAKVLLATLQAGSAMTAGDFLVL